MQLLTITLSLASAISAIDVFFHANQGCSGVSRLGCYAMNPNVSIVLLTFSARQCLKYPH
jgi:hypothetical protein